MWYAASALIYLHIVNQNDLGDLVWTQTDAENLFRDVAELIVSF
jgi:hypothetical protein